MLSSVIDERTIAKLKEEKSRNTKFLVISYDLPSENRDSLDLEEKKMLHTARTNIMNCMKRNCVYLADSVYIVAVSRMELVLAEFSLQYEGFERERFCINLKIVGNAYSDVIFNLLKGVIEKSFAENTDKLELLEARLFDLKDVEFLMKNRCKKELVGIRRRLLDTEKRIEDLCLIDEVCGKKYHEEFMVIDGFRAELFDRCRRF